MFAFFLMLALATPPQAPAAPAQPDVATAERLFATGRFRDAEVVAEALTRAKPDDASIWSLLGNARFAQKDYEPAAAAFERALAIQPKERVILDNLGCSYFLSQHLDQARAAFERSLTTDADGSRAHSFLARIAALRDDSATAEREFEASIRAKNVDSLAPFHFGLYLMQERRIEDASKQFEHALRVDPDFAGAHMNLALALQRRGDPARADFHMRRFRELTEAELSDDRKRLRVTALLRDVQREYEASNIDAALALALEAARVAPEAPVVHQTLSRLYQLKGNAELATKELDIARSLAEPRK
jgi:Flp pilus assembly protein TadD